MKFPILNLFKKTKGVNNMQITIQRGLTPRGQKCVGITGELNRRKKWVLTLLDNGTIALIGMDKAKNVELHMERYPKSSFLLSENGLIFSNDLYELLGSGEKDMHLMGEDFYFVSIS